MNSSPQTRILVVEDDFKLGLALSLRLKNMGYEVVQAHDGVQAIELIKDAKPDLILLDISLPCADGFTVAESVYEIRENAHVPIVFITASKKVGLKKKALELGAAGFLEKPFERDQIEEILENALRESREKKSCSSWMGIPAT